MLSARRASPRLELEGRGVINLLRALLVRVPRGVLAQAWHEAGGVGPVKATRKGPRRLQNGLFWHVFACFRVYFKSSERFLGGFLALQR